jgi:hypothetical protein
LGELLVGLTGADSACRRCGHDGPPDGRNAGLPVGGRRRGDRREGFTFGRTGRAGVALVYISVSVTSGLIAAWGGYAPTGNSRWRPMAARSSTPNRSKIRLETCGDNVRQAGKALRRNPMNGVGEACRHMRSTNTE